MTEQDEQEGMHRRRITLADGRYLIFYTFDEPTPAPMDVEAESAAARVEPEARPEAEEERRV